MKFTVVDLGDPSVGIFSAFYHVEAPFNADDVEPETIEWFRSKLAELYAEFADGKIVVWSEVDKDEE